MIRCFTILAICTALVWSFSCKQGEVGPRLGAVAGQDTSVQIGDTVYLDLSGSFGKDYDIEWSIISQPAIDTIAFSQSDSAYIIPSRNGLYTIQLRISRGNEFSEDFMSITVSGAIPLSGTITGDSTLTIINVGLETDYIVTSDLTVSGYLTIEEGVIIEFEEDVGLIITESGTLMAENATMKPTENQWKGIHLMGQGNVLANNLLVNGGSSSYTNEITEAAALILTGSAKASVSGNTFESSGSYGIVVKDQAGFVFDNPSYTYPFRNNKFKSSGLGPLKIPVTVLAKLSSPDFSEESEESYLMLYESTYPAAELVSANLSNYGIPFRISGTLKFDQPLSILPGTEVYFTRTGGIIINGNLNINGSSSDPVILDGFTGTPGSWNGIYVKNGNTLITYATITNAGYRTLEGLEELSCLTVEGTLNMQHCEVSHCNGIGIWLKDDAVIEYPANFYGNTVSNNKTCAVRLGLDDAYKLAGNNSLSEYSSNTPLIEIRYGKVDNPGTWKNFPADIDYKMVEDVKLLATKELTIEPGVVIQFSQMASLEIAGSLNAIGTASQNIIFEGEEDSAGFWGSILINTDDHVELDYVNIRDGGGDTDHNASLVILPGATDISMTNSSVTNSSGYGVLVKSGASDFDINDPIYGNTFEGSLGGFLNEN